MTEIDIKMKDGSIAWTISNENGFFQAHSKHPQFDHINHLTYEEEQCIIASTLEQYLEENNMVFKCQKK